MMSKIVLKNFWSSLYSSPIYDLFEAYFATLFNHPDVSKRFDVIEVWSVFSCAPAVSEVYAQNSRVLRVQYSGEGFYDNVAKYDINLIPALSSVNVVPCILAGVHLNIHNFWAQLQRPKWNESDHNARRFCSFVVSNGGPMERKAFFQRLSKFKKVDSCGRFANNWGVPIPDADSPEYFTFLSGFRFMICFENTRVDYYMTEKVINAYLGGCVPIYWGCPQAADILNPEAILMLDENASDAGFQKLFERVVAMEKDSDLYRRMYEQPLFKDGIPSPWVRMSHLQECIVKCKAIAHPTDT